MIFTPHLRAPETMEKFPPKPAEKRNSNESNHSPLIPESHSSPEKVYQNPNTISETTGKGVSDKTTAPTESLIRLKNSVPDEAYRPEDMLSSIDKNLRLVRVIDQRIGNDLYLVSDQQGQISLLKVATAEENVRRLAREALILSLLEERGVDGVPRLLKRYFEITPDGLVQTDSSTPFAYSREYVPGTTLENRAPDAVVFAKLQRTCDELLNAGISVPADLNATNVVVSDNGDPFIIDMEEAAIIGTDRINSQIMFPPGWGIASRPEVARRLRNMWNDAARTAMAGSTNKTLRLLDKVPIVNDFLAAVLYRMPISLALLWRF